MTHAPSPEATKEPPKLLLSGLDSLYVSFFLDVSACGLDWDELAFQKEAVQQAHDERFSEIRLGTETFALRPYGIKPYRYVLSNRAFEVRLAERMSPSCHVQFYSEALWQKGLDALIARFRAWCVSMDLYETRPEVVARADWAFDFCLPVMDVEPEWFVTRARKDAIYRENQAVQTFQLGRDEVVVRLYDKVAEIEQESAKAWFFELWGQNADVWRTEFQVRGSRLKNGGIRTLRDLRTFQGDRLRELATNHTTLRRPSGGMNRSRWPYHELWGALLKAIDALPKTGLVRELDENVPLSWMEYQACKAVYGYAKRLGMVSYLKEGKDKVPGLQKVLASLPRLMEEFHNENDWHDAVKDRVKAYRLGQ